MERKFYYEDVEKFTAVALVSAMTLVAGCGGGGDEKSASGGKVNLKLATA